MASKNKIITCLLLANFPFYHSVRAETSKPETEELSKRKVTEQPEVITVYGVKSNTSPEQELLNKVAGGTNLIDLQEFKGSQASLAKVLISEPGSIVQELFGGNDQPRINIRGSGIQDNPVSRGIQLLYDGLSLNQADGSFIFGLLDPEQASSISVYRGANANRYGGTTLGGAIDFNLRNAINSPSSSASIELGSYQSRKLGFRLQNREDTWDYSLQTSYSESEGWRDHSNSKRSNLALNVGWDIKEIENRTYINWTDNDFDIPFLLSKERSIDDPQSILGDYDTSFDQFMNIRNREPHRDTQQLRLANKSLWQTTNTEQSFGIYAEKIDDEFKNPVVQANTKSSNYGLDYALTYNGYEDTGFDTDYQIFVSLNSGSMPREHYSVAPSDGRLLLKFADVDQEASNMVIGAQILHPITTKLQVVAALQWVENEREIIDQLNDGILDSTFSYSVLNPKLGIIYNAADNHRYYANISKSSESPTFWQLAISSPNPNDPLNAYLQINNLKMQTAQTFEIGTQRQGEYFSWQVGYYYAEVEDELISEVQDFAIDGTTVNYDHDTLHQGFELGINANTLTGIFNDDDYFTFKVTYNWSDFTFDGGRYDKKHIAGVPEHLFYSEVGYSFSENLFLNINIRWQPEKTYVDHSNAGLTQDDYLLLGAKLIWKPTSKIDFFIDAQNLTGEVYQTAYVVRGFSADDPNVPTFIPGPDFNLSANLTINW